MHRVENRTPESTILPILKQNLSQYIRLVAQRDGTTIRDVTYRVPPSASEVNQLFRNRLYWDWMRDSEEPLLDIGDVVIAFPASELEARRRPQAFAHGISHCLFEPIRAWCLKKRQGAATARTKRRYEGLLKKIERYASQYERGCPEAAIYQIADELQLDIIIEVPLEDDESKIFLEARSQRKRLRSFRFLNTRWDHVELNELTTLDDDAEVECTRQQLLDHVTELDAQGVYYTYNKDRHGVSSVRTLHEARRVHTSFSQEVKAFEQDTGIAKLKIDAIGDRDLSEFVCRGLHYNVNSVDFKPYETTELEHIDIASSYASFWKCRLYEKFPNKLTDLRPTNQIEGPGLYLIDELDWTHADPKFVEICERLGMPYSNLNIYPNPDLELLSGMGVRFNILEGCWAGGSECKFDFRFPGEKTNATGMFQKDEDGVVFYAKYVGSCNQIQGEETYWVKGERSFFEHVKAQSKRKMTIRWFTDSEAQIAYPKKHVNHLSQFPAWINAYERINVIDQLMTMELDKIVRVSKDGIIFEPHKFERKEYMRPKPPPALITKPARQYCTNVWRSDLEPLTRDDEDDWFSPAHPPYSTGTWRSEDEDIQERVLPRLDAAQYVRRAQHPVEANLGIGGGGKTYRNLIDKGLQRVFYIAPSWKLARQKEAEFGCRVTVTARALHEDPVLWSEVEKCANVLVWDEVSMMWSQTVQLILERYPHHKHIFCGDPGFQLPPIRNIGDERDLTPFSAETFRGHVEYFNESRRCKCPELRSILSSLRSMIQDGEKNTEEIGEWVIHEFKRHNRVITMEEALSKYKIEDTILVSRVSEPENYVKEYTDALRVRQPAVVKTSLSPKTREVLVPAGKRRRGHEELVRKHVSNGVKLQLNVGSIQKYRVLSNDRVYSNGDIVCGVEPPKNVRSELQHAFTIHSVQGDTVTHGLFVDARRMFEVQHWYTALSRAENLEQIFIVDPPQQSASEVYSKTKIYKIVSDESNTCYIGHTTKSLEERFKAHCREFKNPNKKKGSSSAKVLKCKGARIELIEDWPCASMLDAKVREAHWIERTVGCVNVCLPSQSRAAYEVRKTLMTPTPQGPILPRREVVDVERLNGTLQHLDEHKHLLQGEGMSKVRDVYDYLKRLKSSLVDNAYINVEYHKNLIGNHFARGGSEDERSVSMQGCFRGLRAMLVGAHFHDVDMANAIPNLLVQFLENPDEHEVHDLHLSEFVHIKEYVEHRGVWLTEIASHHDISRDSAKELVLRVMYGGSYETWLTENVKVNTNNVCKRVRDLYRSMRKVRTKVLSSEKWSCILSWTREKKKQAGEDECARSAFALITQELQDRVLLQADRAFRELGWCVASLIFDGMLVKHREDANLAETLRLVEESVLEHTSYRIQLLEKPLYGQQDAPIPELEPLRQRILQIRTCEEQGVLGQCKQEHTRPTAP